MKTKSLVIAIFLGLLVFTSCNKDDLPLNSENNITDEIGILHFNSMEEFESTINQIIAEKEYYKSLNNTTFTSLRTLNDIVLKSSSGESATEDTLVVSDAFASVLNSEREVIVADNLFKVSKHGTFKSTESNLELLRELDKLESITDLLRPFNQSDLKSASVVDENYYAIDGYDDVFIYDTFEQYGSGSSGNTYTSTISEPNYDNFVIKTESQTIFGDAWDALFGYSNSTKVWFNNDSKKCVDVKLYCVSYLVYSETGIKVKTQKKGFLGILDKVNVDEIRVGWDYVELEQKLPNLTSDVLGEMKKWTTAVHDPVTQQYKKYLGIAKTQFAKKTYFSIDLLVDEFEVTNKDVLKLVIKGGYNWAKSTFGSSPNLEAVREISPYEPKKARLKLDKYELSGTNTDKETFVFKNDFGFIVSVSVNLSNLNVNPTGFQPAAEKYEIKKASVYGCARNGSEWKGVRYNYKYN